MTHETVRRRVAKFGVRYADEFRGLERRIGRASRSRRYVRETVGKTCVYAHGRIHSRAMRQHAVPRTPHPADLDAAVATFKALADPTRVRVVLAIVGGEQAVGALVTGLALPQTNVSRHLAVLRAAGLVVRRREATHVYYRLADGHVADLVREAFAHAEHVRRRLPNHGPAPVTPDPASVSTVLASVDGPS